MRDLLEFDEGTLANGVRFAYAQIPDYPDAFFSLRIQAGAVYEPIEELGRTHFLEHLLVDHTPDAAGDPFTRQLEALTGRPIQASAGYELLASDNRCPVNDLPLLISLWAGQLLRRSFLPEVVEKQRQIILREIGPAQSVPFNRRLREWLRDFLQGHPYSRPVAGTDATVSRLTLAQLEVALEHDCTGANVVIVGASRLPLGEFVATLDSTFGALPPGTPNVFPPGPVPVPEPAEWRDSPEGVYVPVIYWWVRTPGSTERDFYLGRATFEYLGGTLHAPLYRKLRDERQLCYQVNASYDGYRTRGGVSTFQVVNPPLVRIEEARDVLRETIEELASGVVDTARLEQMRNALVRTYFGQVIEPPGTQVSMATARMFGCVDAHPETVRRFYEELEPEDLTRFAATYLAGKGQLAIFIPPEHVATTVATPAPASTAAPGAPA